MLNEETNTGDNIAEPTKEASGTIKAIGKDTVHKICSGQVVLSLAVAVKELVENSIDAGATLVEIKLHDHGLESVEVSDNGCGVEDSNLEAMTAKYHTSKIREFEDLQGVETFGFRGEALSSLCALTDMTIITRHKSSEVGIKIELDHNGKVKKRTSCARSTGTTVALTNIFVTLPVRRRDFTRNIKKEFAKMCQILQAYCLVSKGVRIICSNNTPKGSKTVVMQTNGAQDIMANIAAVFGNKQTADIISLKSPFNDTENELTEEKLRDIDESIQITPDEFARLKAAQCQLEGFVSSCSHGAGRSSKDRQFFYINSRPCDPKNIAKLMNEIYHRYNGHQFPFIFLNVHTARCEIDVNLTPDKRQLLINNEKLLLLIIKKALIDTYGNIPATYKMQNANIKSMFKKESNDDMEKAEANSSLNKNDNEDGLLPASSMQRFMDVLSQWKHTGDTNGTAPHLTAKRKRTEEVDVRTLKMKKIQEFLTSGMTSDNQTNTDVGSSINESESDNSEQLKYKSELNLSNFNVELLEKESAEYDSLTAWPTVERIDCKVLTPAKPSHNFIKLKQSIIKDVTTSAKSSVEADTDDDESLFSSPFSSQTSCTKTIELDDNFSELECANSRYTCAEMRSSLSEIQLNVQAEENYCNAQRSKANLERLRFKSDINPNQNKNAEAELQREISKKSFALMEIIGQFNLGFIIVKLDEDLFIVDQHATDEKYNFEMLQRTTVLQNQTLAVSQALEMTAVNEMVLLDNLPIFEKNGFKFQIDKNAPATKKVRLLGKPFSKNWEFGKDDIDELIFMLQDAPEGTSANCRPSRIRAMFASRACRKSVMIGKALNHSNMKTLIRHMGEIEQPWNCPHGRPTMRHLINTAMLLDEDESSDVDSNACSENL